MNILVLNGSPRGKSSSTLQTSRYIQKRYPAFNFEFINVAQQIRVLEKDFSKVSLAIENADLIIFSYPVYTFLAPYQLHRFIELLKANDITFHGKFVTQITTSKHFFDTTAHNFIQENCKDLGAKFIYGLSQDMDDLLSIKGQEETCHFFEKLIFDVKHDIYEQYAKPSIKPSKPAYTPCLEKLSKSTDKNIVLVTNVADDDTNLLNMISDFKATFPYEVKEINVRNFNFSGGCLGCLSCTVTEKCIYKDGFEQMLRDEIQTADATIYAFTIENHFTHSSFKCYDDRQFCNGHRTLMRGKSVGYIISGDYDNEPNLKTVVQARAEVAGVYLAGVANDMHDTTSSITMLSQSLDYAIKTKIKKPANFYGVGGTKIFRDLIYVMRGFMKADHQFYKTHGMYDYPHKQVGRILLMYLVGAMTYIPSMQIKIKKILNEQAVVPYQKVIDEASPKDIYL